MTVSLKHAFTSAKSDGTDATLVQPSNWNAEHTLTAASGKVLGTNTSSTTVGELSLAVDSNGNLGVNVSPSPWYPGFTAVTLPYGDLYGGSSGGVNSIGIYANAFIDSGTGADTYRTTGQAAAYFSYLGGHHWATAPSGTAGSNVTFTERMTLDVDGNLGLGTSPSTWDTGTNAIEFTGGSVYSSGGVVGMYQNAYYDGVEKYKSYAQASVYRQYSGAHYWSVAPVGNPGDTIYTFTDTAMVLTNNGLLGIGTDAPYSPLHVKNAVGTMFLETTDNTYGAYLGVSANSVNTYFGVEDSTGTIFGAPAHSTIFYNGTNNKLFVFRDGSGDRLFIAQNGALGLAGANYGTAGQVLTSNGSNSAPYWSSVSGSGISLAEARKVASLRV